MDLMHTHFVAFIETSSLESLGLFEAWEGEAVGDIYYYYLFCSLIFFFCAVSTFWAACFQGYSS